MMLIRKFIDAGWYTAPLSGTMVRDAYGKKTGGRYPKKWNTYRDSQSQIECTLALGFTGKESGVIAIDCDTQKAYKEVCKHVPESYSYRFLPRNEGVNEGYQKGGGTIIFSYTPRFSQSWGIKDGDIEIDILADGRTVLLPLEDNKTKIQWNPSNDIPELMDIPEELTLYLNQYKKAKRVGTVREERLYTTNLIKLVTVQIGLQCGVCYAPLWAKLTPITFRRSGGKPHYPTDVEEGERSNYLSMVSAILGADDSISTDLYAQAMVWINDSLPNPLSLDELETTIIQRMASAVAMGEDGTSIWRYKKQNAGELRLFKYKSVKQADSIFGQCITTRRYYIIDLRDEIYFPMESKGKALQELATDLGGTIPKSDLGFIMESGFKLEVDFTKRFGEIIRSDNNGETPVINIYSPTQEMEIMMGWKNAQPYMHPVATLEYFNTFIPDEAVRTFVLKFIRHRLLTREYSPIFFQIIGVGGSGKGIFTTILERLFGERYTHQVTAQDLLGTFTGWLEYKELLILDEISETATIKERRQIKGKVKNLTGGTKTNIRSMRTESRIVENNALIVLTSNTPVLDVDASDRRMLTWNTPQILKNESWVGDMGGDSRMYHGIMGEIESFAQYLREEIEPFSNEDEYTTPLTTAYKSEMYESSLPVSDLILYRLENNDWEGLEKILHRDGLQMLLTGDISLGFDEEKMELEMTRDGAFVKVRVSNISRAIKYATDSDYLRPEKELARYINTSTTMSTRYSSIGGERNVQFVMVERKYLDTETISQMIT